MTPQPKTSQKSSNNHHLLSLSMIKNAVVLGFLVAVIFSADICSPHVITFVAANPSAAAAAATTKITKRLSSSLTTAAFATSCRASKSRAAAAERTSYFSLLQRVHPNNHCNKLSTSCVNPEGPSIQQNKVSFTPLSMSSSSSSDKNNDDNDDTPTVIIAGAGVIGVSTAYYLAINHSIKTILIDPTGEIAPAASGKAGGFLALDWNDYSPLRSLTRRSFVLHSELAETLGKDKIMYRRLTCANVSVNPIIGSKWNKPSGKKLEGVEWVDPDEENSQMQVSGVRMLGDESTIAQVHPKMLCDKLWDVTKQTVDGCKLIQGEVVSPAVEKNNDDDDDNDGLFIGVTLADGTVIKGNALLYSCGPWTKFGTMMGVKYHSAIIPTPNVLTQSVFFAGCGDPEVYPRPDKTAYCTGFPDAAVKVTEKPGHVEVRKEKIQEIVDSVRKASSKKKMTDDEEGGGALSADPVLEQACYLPSTLDGLPIMGKLSSSSIHGGGDRCYVAAGHGCWGILMGPATGEAMANVISKDIVTDGKGNDKNAYELDLRSFDPARFGL